MKNNEINERKPFDASAFDAAASVAEKELKDSMTLNEVAEWWSRNYMKAGHKRLGRILVARSREAKKK
jgi:hypothetical protein